MPHLRHKVLTISKAEWKSARATPWLARSLGKARIRGVMHKSVLGLQQYSSSAASDARLQKLQHVEKRGEDEKSLYR